MPNLSIPPVEQVHQAAIRLSSPAPYVERELASILAVWLNSVYRRMLESDVPPDWNYALEVARLVLSRGLPALDSPGRRLAGHGGYRVLLRRPAAVL